MLNYRSDHIEEGDIDLETAVDVAIRDLQEILSCWGSDVARQRAVECERTLRTAFTAGSGVRRS